MFIASQVMEKLGHQVWKSGLDVQERWRRFCKSDAVSEDARRARGVLLYFTEKFFAAFKTQGPSCAAQTHH